MQRAEIQGDCKAHPAECIGGMRLDLSYGLTSVLILSLGVVVYSMGSAGVPSRWIGCLVAMLLAGAVTFLAGTGLAGRAPRLRHLLADALATGLLAASVSSEPLWKAPAVWLDFFRLSAFGAALFCVLYHASNTINVAVRRRHIGLLGGGILMVLPFASGCLLGLQPGSLADRLGGGLASLAPFSGEWLARYGGRTLLLLVFNELLVNAFSLGLRRMLLTGWRARLCLLACSGGAVLAPSIADFGSASSLLTGSHAMRSIVVLASTMLSQGLLWAEVFLLTGVMLDGLNRKRPSWLGLARHAILGLTNGAIFSGVFMSLVLGVDGVVGTEAARAAYRAFPVLGIAAVAALAFPLLKAIVESFDGSRSFARRVVSAFLEPVLYARGAMARSKSVV